MKFPLICGNIKVEMRQKSTEHSHIGMLRFLLLPLRLEPSLYNLPIPCYNELEMRYSPSNR